MRRLPALTIIELCIVMLLSAIVTGIGFFTLDIFQRSIRKFKTDSSSLSDITLVHRLIHQDFWKSTMVTYKENGFIAAGKGGETVYEFNPDFIARTKAGMTDTFSFTIQNVKLFFQEEEISVPGLPIDELNFELTHKEEVHTFAFAKIYAADVLMQHNASNLK